MRLQKGIMDTTHQRLFFFFSPTNLWCSQGGDHPYADLTKFGH
jgi:hypothetical protein